MKELLHGFMAIKRPGRPEEVAGMVATIGIIGAGEVGSQIARAAVSSGYCVVIANSRGPEALADLIAELGPSACAATASDAASAGDFVVIARPGSGPLSPRRV